MNIWCGCATRTDLDHGVAVTALSQALVVIEERRLRALVAADAVELDALHDPDFVLVNPSGSAWSKADYVGGIISGRINYRRFEAVTDIEVLVDAALAVLRYRSAIDIHVQGQTAGPLQCWHTDCYRRISQDDPWRVIWSQATEIGG